MSTLLKVATSWAEEDSPSTHTRLSIRHCVVDVMALNIDPIDQSHPSTVNSIVIF